MNWVGTVLQALAGINWVGSLEIPVLLAREGMNWLGPFKVPVL